VPPLWAYRHDGPLGLPTWWPDTDMAARWAYRHGGPMSLPTWWPDGPADMTARWAYRHDGPLGLPSVLRILAVRSSGVCPRPAFPGKPEGDRSEGAKERSSFPSTSP
jgi:hypothetical protein